MLFMSLIVGEGANDWAVLPGVDGEGRPVEDGYKGDNDGSELVGDT